MTMIEYSSASGETLILNKPYQQLSYPEKVIMMVKNGFLTPVDDTFDELNSMARLSPEDSNKKASNALSFTLAV